MSNAAVLDKSLRQVTSISVPANERAIIEQGAERHHLTRSELYVQGALYYLAKLDHDDIDAQVAEINKVIALVGQPSTDFIEHAADELMESVEW